MSDGVLEKLLENNDLTGSLKHLGCARVDTEALINICKLVLTRKRNSLEYASSQDALLTKQ